MTGMGETTCNMVMVEEKLTASSRARARALKQGVLKSTGQRIFFIGNIIISPLFVSEHRYFAYFDGCWFNL